MGRTKGRVLKWQRALIDRVGESPPPRLKRSSIISVLAALVIHADADGSNCYPAQSTIAGITGLHHTTVKDVLEWMDAEGWIEHVRNRDRGLREWRLTIPPEPEIQIAAGAQSDADPDRGSDRGSCTTTSYTSPRSQRRDVIRDTGEVAFTDPARTREGRWDVLVARFTAAALKFDYDMPDRLAEVLARLPTPRDPEQGPADLIYELAEWRPAFEALASEPRLRNGEELDSFLDEAGSLDPWYLAENRDSILRRLPEAETA